MSACDRFRQHLEDALSGPSDPDALRALGWHEHLFTCGECRALLEGEEALEFLLGVLPEVRLPSELAVRVLARLRALELQESERALDRVLSRGPVPEPPADLGRRVLAGVRTRRADLALDAVLERLPLEAPPATLARGVLRACVEERASVTERIALPQRWTWAAAAAVLIALGAWILGGGPDGERPTVAEVDEVEPELLAALDVLENWELLLSEDVDVVLGGLEVVDPEALLSAPESDAGLDGAAEGDAEEGR